MSIVQRSVSCTNECLRLAHAETLQSAARDVQSAMSACSYAPVRGLICECRDGALIVSGKLPSFYLKQVAITLVMVNLRAGIRFDQAIEVE